VVSRRGEPGETSFAAATEFCRVMCPQPLLPGFPVYGFNNWYCNYGNYTAVDFLANAEYLTGLANNPANPPFAVVDAGWQRGAESDTVGGGYWDRTNSRFGSTLTMADIARRLKGSGSRPGLWFRPLFANPDHPKEWRLARDPKYLDPSVPEVLAYVRETVTRIRKWGYDLIKYDFTTWDLTGRWGFEMGPDVTSDGWSLADRSRTTAEVIRDLYRDIRKAAGEEVNIIGCNTVGHLAAGLVEIQRIGDDTSGTEWDRTRKMGINSLAFRAPQHSTFFAIDGDCAGQVAVDSVPWEKNRQWLDLLARSGTPLFVSFKKDTVSPVQEEALRAAFSSASGELATGEPVDWLENTTPARWVLDGKETNFNW
jgi:alpha-galactosidase